LVTSDLARDMGAIRFAPGPAPRETLRALVIEVADRSGIEKRARERGYPVADAGVEFCGVRFQLVSAQLDWDMRE
jgi:hypothetical protein